MLAPCALEQVITHDNAADVKAKIVVEGANGPITPAADEILEERGVLVLPDILANAGGVVVSYFEWVQGLQEYFWKEPEVNSKLHDIVTRAFNETWHVYEDRADDHAPRRVRARGRARRRSHGDPWPLPVTSYGALDDVAKTVRVAVFYGAGCHLCERALAQVRDSTRSSSSSSRRSTSPATPSSRRATASCPVVEIDGERAFVYYVHEDAFRRR